MLRSKKKAQKSHNKLRRLLSEPLENRQLMAADIMQWGAVPTHLIAFPSSVSIASSAMLSTQFGGHARAVVSHHGANMNFGQAIMIGEFDLSSTPVNGLDVNKLSASESFGSTVGFGEPISIGEFDLADAMPVPAELINQGTPVNELDLSKLSDSESFGSTVGLGEPIAIDEFDLADVMPVPTELIKQGTPVDLKSVV